MLLRTPRFRAGDFRPAGNDMSFVHTSWDDGIEPWRFQLPTDWDPSFEIAHTIFDRTLFRPGETVHMKHLLRGRTLAGFSLLAATGNRQHPRDHPRGGQSEIRAAGQMERRRQRRKHLDHPEGGKAWLLPGIPCSGGESTGAHTAGSRLFRELQSRGIPGPADEGDPARSRGGPGGAGVGARGFDGELPRGRRRRAAAGEVPLSPGTALCSSPRGLRRLHLFQREGEGGFGSGWR